jgi:CheY-like chemotaxis protein
VLEKLGYRADVVPNGQEAVHRLAAHHYAGVLMDVQMPVMDGCTAATEVRRHEPADQHVPIIAMTAGALTGDREMCLAAGMDDYLTKPIDPTEVARVLSRWIDTPPEVAAAPPALIEVAGDDREGLIRRRLLEVFDSPEPRDPLAVTALVAFLERAPQLLASVTEAVQCGDDAQARMAVHSLRGAAANIGAAPLATMATDVQAMVDRAERERVHASLADLDAELGATTDTVRGVLASTGPPAAG